MTSTVDHPRTTASPSRPFQQGKIDGAWLPEPYACMLVDEGGQVLVDEADLWPDGQFVTTQLLVRTDFLSEHPDLVNACSTANDRGHRP